MDKPLEQEDPDLIYTQNLRKLVIEKLIEENKGKPPTDKESAYVLATYLDGIDRQSIAKQRIQISKKDSSTQAQMARVLEEMMKRRIEGENVEIDITPSPQALNRNAMLTGNWLPAPTVVSGELDVVGVQETPEQFFERVEQSNPDLLTGSAIEDD